jgi:hypothetical protein
MAIRAVLSQSELAELSLWANVGNRLVVLLPDRVSAEDAIARVDSLRGRLHPHHRQTHLAR